MKREHGILTRFLRKTDLPRELDTHRFFVQWFGPDECTVEQHRGILCFERTAIRFSTEQGILTIAGDSLLLEQLTDTGARIRGTIASVSLEGKS